MAKVNLVGIHDMDFPTKDGGRIDGIALHMNIKFANTAHEKAFYKLISSMKNDDCYHKAVAYLLTLDNVCREHITDLFDLKEDIILFDGLRKGWQTGTSLRTTRLAYNLWCTYIDENPKYSTPDEIFCCSYAPYYFEAIMLRYPEYLEMKEV